MNAKLHLLLLLIGFTVTGCSDKSVTADAPVSKAKALNADDGDNGTAEQKKSEPYDATIGGYKFTVPGQWPEQPRKSDYILGEFSIPGTGGAARLTLSSAGGGVQANITRWKEQFQPGPKDDEPKESQIKFDGNPATLVELHGAYTEMGGNAKKNSRLLGVVAPIEGTNFFIKMTGPSSTVTENRDKFLKFVESARMKK